MTEVDGAKAQLRTGHCPPALMNMIFIFNLITFYRINIFLCHLSGFKWLLSDQCLRLIALKRNYEHNTDE